ncbi:MAG: hypothetical protein QNJ54_23245 [Prochloraceae cyanobacterium]|nr:hypothetical protein [Prochloraceae cyanobacterium]
MAIEKPSWRSPGDDRELSSDRENQMTIVKSRWRSLRDPRSGARNQQRH